MSKYAHVVLALSLILPLTQAPADARPSGSSSFRSGFSSSSSSSAARASKPASGGFGSFGSRSAASSSVDAHKSDSAMSRKLDQQSAEANALRTLDARRQAQAPQQEPGAVQAAGSQADAARTPPPNGYGSGPVYGPAQAPIIVRQDSGLGNVVAGAIIARSLGNAHANNQNSGANSVDQGAVGKAASGGSVLGSIVRTILWLLMLALIGWIAYYAWKRMRSRRAANKPNYSFERN